ncbi:MAG: hypothetical protein ACLFNN_01750 [Candidatus Paceibacterota bacterium]
MSKEKAEKINENVAIEYGVIAAIYMFLTNAIINNILSTHGDYSLMVSALFWVGALLLITTLLPYAIEDRKAIKNKKDFVELSAFSFTAIFIFFIAMIGIVFLFTFGISPSLVVFLITALIIPVMVSAFIFYFLTLGILEKEEEAQN